MGSAEDQFSIEYHTSMMKEELEKKPDVDVKGQICKIFYEPLEKHPFRSSNKTNCRRLSVFPDPGSMG